MYGKLKIKNHTKNETKSKTTFERMGKCNVNIRWSIKMCKLSKVCPFDATKLLCTKKGTPNF